VLFAVITVVYGATKEEVIGWLKKENLEDELSPYEKSFLSKQNERNKINISWKVEALTSLLWVIKKIDTFPKLTELVDTELVKKVMVSPPADTSFFIKSSELREQSEIDEVYENVYESHWKVRDAQIKGHEPPESLNSGVVMERHYGFNWVNGYCGQGWDDISTDT